MSGGFSNSEQFNQRQFLLTTQNSLNLNPLKKTRAVLFNITCTSGTSSDSGYLKLFNSVAAPTVGVTPSIMTLPIGALSAQTIFNFDFNYGIIFSAGLWIATTMLPDDSDATMVQANTAKIVMQFL